jgi:hypothetical protein
MLFKPFNLIDGSEVVSGPYYIVGELCNYSDIYYIQRLAHNLHASFPCDEVFETTKNIWDAKLFVFKNDAVSVCDERCGSKCNCGAIHNIGQVFEVVRSGREQDGVTYGLITNDKKKKFEVLYDVKLIYQKGD